MANNPNSHTCLITGPTSGIGKAGAIQLADKDWQMYFLPSYLNKKHIDNWQFLLIEGRQNEN